MSINHNKFTDHHALKEKKKVKHVVAENTLSILIHCQQC